MVRWLGKKLHILALSDSLSTEITAFADLNQRSFNAEVTATLEERYSGQISIEARLSVVNSLLKSLERDGGSEVVNSRTYQIICKARDSLRDSLGPS